MATINFYLDKPDRKGQSPVFLVYQHKGKKFKYFTKEKVPAKSWANQKVKKNYSFESDVNGNLETLLEAVKKIERDARFLSITISVDYVYEKLIEYLQGGESPNSFYKVCEDYIKASETNKTAGTISIKKATLSRIREFEKEKKYRISFDTLNSDFYERYQKYLIEDLKFLNNTVGNHIKTIKSFMNYATDKGINKNLDYKKFKVHSEEADLVYLTEEELLKIYSLELDSTTLVNVRDNFCFACFTGLRFSDLSQLKAENIKDGFIILKTEKTRDTLKIPLNDYAQEILNKYQGVNKNSLPVCLSIQIVNVHLKQIGFLANIIDPIHIVKYSGAKKIKKTYLKYKLIGTHTARRTFVTLALEKGIRPELVMSMTGHKSYPCFKKYIKITDKVKFVEMNRLWKKPA